MILLQNFKEKIYNAMELPKEVFTNVPFVTIVGNEEVVIENYKAVIDYKADYIKVNTKIGVIKITGKNINIKFIKRDEIGVTGYIKNVEYSN